MNRTIQTLAASALLAVGGAASAHGDAHAPARPFDPAQVEATPFGEQGDPRRVVRTVRVAMDDAMRFTPSALTVRRGETIRFVVDNRGALLHEMVLGTPQALKEHAELMKRHPGMEHDDPGIAHVRPGASGAIAWRFTQPGTFQFACLQPGHFEAGMVGQVTVR
ncbi:MAG: plastocyanin [Comamonadaceae bacterium]|nr:MAG: plastocyanin [Comamonadaceae bacterium]